MINPLKTCIARQSPVSNDSVYSQPEPQSHRATGRLGALSRKAKNSQLTRVDTHTILTGTSSCAPASPPRGIHRMTPALCALGLPAGPRGDCPSRRCPRSTAQARPSSDSTVATQSQFHFPAWPAMGCSRPFLPSLPGQPECLTLPVPPPRPPLDHSVSLPRHPYVVTTIGHIARVAGALCPRERGKKWTRTRVARRAVLVPHPSPGDLAAVVGTGAPGRLGVQIPKVVWHSGALCLIDDKFPSLVARRQLLCRVASLPTKKQDAVGISHVHRTLFVRPVACSSMQVRGRIRPFSPRRSCLA